MMEPDDPKHTMTVSYESPLGERIEVVVETPPDHNPLYLPNAAGVILDAGIRTILTGPEETEGNHPPHNLSYNLSHRYPEEPEPTKQERELLENRRRAWGSQEEQG